MIHKLKISFCFQILILLLSCERKKTYTNTYIHHIPKYDSLCVKMANDSIHFILESDNYNIIKSNNTFYTKGQEYIAFHDSRAESILIYNLAKSMFIKNIPLKKCFNSKTLYKTSIYVINFDSIFVINKDKLFLLDSSADIKSQIKFADNSPKSLAVINNENPLTIKNGHIYTAIRSYMNETSLYELKKWQLLYDFNPSKKQATLHYSLPKKLRENIFGHRLLSTSYCQNSNGNFIFSFAGDSCVYETDLKNTYNSYLGQSENQTSPITPITSKDILDDKGLENYLTNDSYGGIYYNRNKKIYIRIFRKKISRLDFKSKIWKKEQSIIIMNDRLQIIGESNIPNEISLSSLFFTLKGELFARINSKDEYALHYIKLVITENH